MAKLNTLQPTDCNHVLVYGPPKGGKSLLCAQLAREFNVLWFDLENGGNTLFQLPPEAQENVELIRLPDTRTYPIAIETCLKIVKANRAIEICETHGKVSCSLCKKDEQAPIFVYDPQKFSADRNNVMVFDSMTQLTNSAIAHITKGEPDEYKLTYDDWGNLGKLMDIFLSHVQQAKYHVCVISHEVEADLEEKGKSKLVPVAGTRNFSRNSAKYFDEVIYCSVINGKHVSASSTTFKNGILTGSRNNLVTEDAKGDAWRELIKIFRAQKLNEEPEETKKVLNKISVTKNAGQKAKPDMKALLAKVKAK
jgi:hypothetical protein